MAVIRVGVQSPAGGAGQVVDLDGPSAAIASITNASAESIQYSLDSGANWTTLAAAAVSGSATVASGAVRMRKVSSGAYPAPVDIDATIAGLGDGSVSQLMIDAFSPGVISGAWRGFSSVVMRLRMAGTGTLVMDSATGDNGGGTVTTSVYSYSPVGTQVDEYAYPGDNARSIRITLTGTATCEVI
jgi:hypothetical protein